MNEEVGELDPVQWTKESAKRVRWGGRDRGWSGSGGALAECMVSRLGGDSSARWTTVPVEEDLVSRCVR